MSKELLFSVTAEDCDWQPLRGSGPGGQHRNKVSTGMRCTHRASGAVGVATDSKSQKANKRNAFARMAESEAFQKWHRLESMRRAGTMAIVEERVRDSLQPRNIKVEGREEGKWVLLEKEGQK